MGGRSKEQVVGWKYYFGIHMGIGRGPVDAIKEVKVGDRTAWLGKLTDNGTINIAQPELFGGDDKEGGVEGPLEVMMGGPTQTASAGLVAMRGSPLPGFRRRVTMFFNGLIGSNNPYPKPWKIRLNRTLQGWDGPVFEPSLASIPLPEGNKTFASVLLNMPLSAPGAENSGLGTVIHPSRFPTGTANYVDGAMELGTGEGQLEYIEPDRLSGATNFFWNVGAFNFNAFDIVEQTIEVFGYDLSNPAAYVRALETQAVFNSDAFYVNVESAINGGINQMRVTVNGGQAIGSVTIYIGAPERMLIRVRHDLKNRTHAVYVNGSLIVSRLMRIDVTHMIDVRLDRLSGNPAARFANYTLTCYQNSDASAMNPAHIIFECLTNREWGRGLDRSRLDIASFTEAASVLYSEGFGLCMKWTRTDEIEVFIQKVIDTIGATLFVSRSTALLTLKLIRADYNIDEIPFFDSESGLLEIRDSAIGVISKSVNSVSVVWHDPLTDEDGKVTVNNPASLLSAGGVANSTTRDFKGIPTAALATRVAQRELRSVSTNLRRLTALFDRRAEGVEPGSVIAVQDLKRGIPKTAFRVGRVEDGTITDGRITLTMAQDVFGLPSNSFTASVPSQWEEPDTSPCVPASQRVIELPYFLMVQNMSKADLDYVSPDGAYLGTLSAKGKPLNIGHRIHVRSGAPEPADTTPGGDYSCEV